MTAEKSGSHLDLIKQTTSFCSAVLSALSLSLEASQYRFPFFKHSWATLQGLDSFFFFFWITLCISALLFTHNDFVQINTRNQKRICLFFLISPLFQLCKVRRFTAVLCVSEHFIWEKNTYILCQQLLFAKSKLFFHLNSAFNLWRRGQSNYTETALTPGWKLSLIRFI